MDHSDLTKTIAGCLGIDHCRVNANLTYQSIMEWGSLQHVNLMVMLSKKYKIEITGQDMVQLNSISKICEFIESQKIIGQERIANLQTPDIQINRGLIDIWYDTSTITSIDAINGILSYRGFNLEDLVEYSTFEEVIFIILHGRQPSSLELLELKKDIFLRLNITDELIEMIKRFIKLPPIKLLQVFISSKSIFWPENNNLSPIDMALTTFINMIACMGVQRLMLAGKTDILSIFEKEYESVAQFCYCMFIDLNYKEDDVHVLEKDMILHVDHESNASTFVARITKSTNASYDNAIIAAIAAFEGDIHGGALLKVVDMFDDISDPNFVNEYINNRIKLQLPIFGFGHRVYKTIDPRAKIMKKIARDSCIKNNNMNWYLIAEQIENEMKSHTKFGLAPNVDFYEPVIYNNIKMDKKYFVPFFAISRSIGWFAHIIEQSANNILIRPRLKYTGNQGKVYV